MEEVFITETESTSDSDEKDKNVVSVKNYSYLNSIGLLKYKGA